MICFCCAQCFEGTKEVQLILYLASIFPLPLSPCSCTDKAPLPEGTTGVTTPYPIADYSHMKNDCMNEGKEWVPNAAGTDGT